MARFFSFLLWTGVFLLILLAIDQFLVRVPASGPTHTAVTTFYRELRDRLTGLATGLAVVPPSPPATPAKPAPAKKAPEPAKTSPTNIEAVIEQRLPPKPVAASAPATRPKTTLPAPAAAKPHVPAPSADSIEAVIDRNQPEMGSVPVKERTSSPRPGPGEPTRRYLYADEQGNLHFAGTLSEIPERYREKARLVGE